MMRKRLQVEKRKILSNSYVNKKHEWVDWTIRIIFCLILLFLFALNVAYYPHEGDWGEELFAISIAFVIVSELARAIMEWKYKENKNEAIFTISQLAFSLILLSTLLLTNGWGLFG
nr:DUF4181 domain-containing protein [Gracilibacillus massiliensis]